MRSKTLLKNTVYNQLMFPILLKVFFYGEKQFKGVSLIPLVSNFTEGLKAQHLVLKLHSSCKTFKNVI